MTVRGVQPIALDCGAPGLGLTAPVGGLVLPRQLGHHRSARGCVASIEHLSQCVICQAG
jgi:hypothetical protein